VTPAEYRRLLDDGREVVVERLENGYWLTWVGEFDPDKGWAGGDNLYGGMIAEVIGYDIVREDYPEWIDCGPTRSTSVA
jgi:hypothetical protein